MRHHQHWDYCAHWNTPFSPSTSLWHLHSDTPFQARQNCFYCRKFISCDLKSHFFLSSETSSFPFSLVLIHLSNLPHTPSWRKSSTISHLFCFQLRLSTLHHSLDLCPYLIMSVYLSLSWVSHSSHLTESFLRIGTLSLSPVLCIL